MVSVYTVLQRRDNSGSYLTERGAQALGVSISFTILATCSVVARLYTRAKIIKRMEPNDWMILIALVSVHRPSNFTNLTERNRHSRMFSLAFL